MRHGFWGSLTQGRADDSVVLLVQCLRILGAGDPIGGCTLEADGSGMLSITEGAIILLVLLPTSQWIRQVIPIVFLRDLQGLQSLCLIIAGGGALDNHLIAIEDEGQRRRLFHGEGLDVLNGASSHVDVG